MKQPSLDITVSILLIIDNSYPQLKKLVPKLLENTIDINYEMIVVDNASTDKSVSYLKSYSIPVPLKISSFGLICIQG